MLYMLRITGDAPAAVMLNGQAAGELIQGDMELPVGGTILMQLFPLERGCLPVTAVLELSREPRLRAAEGTARLYVLAENQVHLKICFERLIREEAAMPYILRRTNPEPGGNLQVTVYFDRLFCFAAERNGGILLSGAFREKLTDARIRRWRDFLLIEGIYAAGTEFFVLALRSEPQVLLHRSAKTVEMQENGLEYTFEQEGIVVRERYSPEERKILSRELGFARGEKNIFGGLLMAIREQEEAFAMSLISPVLQKEAGFGDFCAFIGEYEGFYEPPGSNGEVGLCYPISENVYQVRRLRAAIKNEQIWNIDEI